MGKRLFLGLSLKVRVEHNDTEPCSYYDSDRKTIIFADGFIARASRAFVDRSDKWLIAHELAHAIIDQYPELKRKLTKTFGNMSDDAYSASAGKELKRHMFGFNKTKYLTARASLCAEEDFAECCAYLHCYGHTGHEEPVIHGKLTTILEVLQWAGKRSG